MWDMIGKWLMDSLTGDTSDTADIGGFWEGLLGGYGGRETPEVLTKNSSNTDFVRGAQGMPRVWEGSQDIVRKSGIPQMQSDFNTEATWSPPTEETPYRNFQADFVQQQAMKDILFGPQGQYWNR
tara:strand:+ start:143 stop:517 length:375 start_codon:yes stop_codon:yes gene_type:complete